MKGMWLCYYKTLFKKTNKCCLFKMLLQNIVCKQQTFISHSSGGLRFEIKVPGWLVLIGILFLVTTGTLSVPSHGGRSKGSVWSFSYDITNSVHEDSALCTY